MNVDSVGLSGVLGDLVVDKLNNIESDGSSADSRKSNLAGDFSGVSRVENTNGGSGQHWTLGWAVY
jgi:hypothetical protein